MKPSSNDIFNRPVLYPLALLLLIVPEFIPFFRGRLGFISFPQPHEFLSQWYPYLEFAADSWRSGRPPLWSHNLLGGFPLAAFPHAAQFYPPLCLFMMFKFMTAFPVFVFLHMAARALFTYALLREWPCSRFAAWLGAALFAFSNASVQTVQFLELFTETTWVPALFWLGLRLSRRGRAVDFAALSLCSALAYLAGDVEILLYSWIVLAAVIILIERAPLPRFALVLGALLTGVMACAAPLLLTLNYLHHSLRQGISVNPFITQWKPGLPVSLSWLVYPLPSITVAQFSIYAGVLVPAGFLAAAGRRESKRAVIVTLALLGAATAYSVNLWPLSYVFNSLPLLRFSAVDLHFRSLFPLLFLALAVAGQGFDLMNDGIGPPAQRRIAAGAVIFILLQAFILIIDILAAGGISPLAAFRILFTALMAAAAAFLFRRSRAGRALVLGPLILVMVLFLDLGAPAYLGVPRTNPLALQRPVENPLLNRDRDTGRIHLVSYAVTSADLWRMFRLDRGPGFICGFIRNGLAQHTRLLSTAMENTTSPFDARVIREQTMPWLDYMAVHYVISFNAPVWASEPRFLDSPLLKSAYKLRGNYAGPRPPAAGAAHRLEPGSQWSVTLATELLPGDELAMEVSPPQAKNCLAISAGPPPVKAAAWARAAPLPDGSSAEALALPPFRPGENLVSIAVSPECPASAVIALPRVIGPGRRLRLFEQNNRHQLYENLDGLDRYGIYTAVTPAEDNEAEKIIFDPDRFDPARLLVLNPRFAPPGMAQAQPRSRRPGDVQTLSYGDSRVVLQTDPPAPAILSIAESYYPGWVAEVDGRPVPIIRADYAYQAVPLLQPGPHRIVLRFIPAEFRAGIWASLASLALLLGFAAMAARNARSRARTTPGP